MLDYLIAQQADAVVGALETPLSEATRFGVIGVDQQSRILQWDEKPSDPMPLPTDPSLAFVSMGIYLFRTEALRDH